MSTVSFHYQACLKALRPIWSCQAEMPGNAMVAISNYYGILSVYNSSILTGVTRILDLNTDTGASQMNQTTATEAADSAAPTTAKVEKVFSSYKIDKLKLT